MFTSLRSRLWLSYASVITIALCIVVLVLLAFLLRNPLLSRQVRERMRQAHSEITQNPQSFLNDLPLLQEVAQRYDVRILVFDRDRQPVFDSDPAAPSLPLPRRSTIVRNIQNARDASGQAWLHTFERLSRERTLMVAAPRPRVPVLNIFADEFLLPILQGGVIALLLSLVFAFGLSRWVADPLQQLVAAARNYPAEPMKPISPRGPREVQDLTHAFNSMVERVDRSQQSQRDFVADVSHELKTPLTSIQGFAQAILDDTAHTPEARRQAAQVIYNEAERMHRMALDLLDLARLQGGTADLKMSRVDMGMLLRTLLERFTPLAKRAGVQLQIQVPDDLPDLPGDGDRLAQVISNLLDNALKFTPSGGQVVLSAANPGDQMEITVADTGPGVRPEALPRLFDRFYQADPSRAGGAQHGAGLGLAIAQEIVRAHGGRISVRSEVGHGTTFVVHLPLANSLTDYE